jgi:hypothetical protein
MWVSASMIANPKRTQIAVRANAFRRILRLCAFVGLGGSAASTPAIRADAPPTLALQDGEVLSYSVRWGFIPAVGTIEISADKLGAGKDAVMRVTTLTATWGLARGIFPFDGRGESLYRIRNGRLISTSEWSAYRDKEVKNSIVFDYDKGSARYVDDLHPEHSRVIEMPVGNPSDLILSLIQTRFWNLVPGQQHDAVVTFEDQIYLLTIHAEGYEYIWTTLGDFKCLVLVPRMEKTPPLGMFKKGSKVRVWIETDDERHLPVRFEVGFKFGVGTATMTDYQPPK